MVEVDCSYNRRNGVLVCSHRFECTVYHRPRWQTPFPKNPKNGVETQTTERQTMPSHQTVLFFNENHQLRASGFFIFNSSATTLCLCLSAAFALWHAVNAATAMIVFMVRRLFTAQIALVPIGWALTFFARHKIF